MHKIESKIVGYAVAPSKDVIVPSKDAEAKVAEPLPILETMHEGMIRPECLDGSTYKVKSAGSDHALYITINNYVLNAGTEHESLVPYEIFLNSKNPEHFQWVIALTRIVSAIFRKGGDNTFLSKELVQIFDPKGGYFKKGGIYVPSTVAEIGMIIESHLLKIGAIESAPISDHVKQIMQQKKSEFEEVHGVSEGEFPAQATLCNKCNTKAVILLDGCMTCLSCADSKCG